MADVLLATPTLDAVARLARVSRATVSRVVNDSPKVSPEARAAVKAAIAELGYVPNPAARSLRTRRTNMIALILSEPEARVFADPFFAAMVRGVTSALADTELHLVLLTAHGNREHAKVERYVRHGHVDGAILVSLHSGDPLPDVLTRARVPAVLVGRPQPGQAIPYVDADNVGGAALATRFLLESGARRVGTVTGPLDMLAGVDRYAGYRAALATAGVPLRPELVASGDFTEEGGEQAVTELLTRVPDLDAVFVASDLMALGALRALRAAGRAVPGDVAVVGFDDLSVASRAEPPLTTVHQPLGAMTRAMADLLLRQIAGDGSADESVVCPTHLVRRASA